MLASSSQGAPLAIFLLASPSYLEGRVLWYEADEASHKTNCLPRQMRRATKPTDCQKLSSFLSITKLPIPQPSVCVFAYRESVDHLD